MPDQGPVARPDRPGVIDGGRGDTRERSPARRVGLGTRRQAAPFQCSINGILPVLVNVSPTAQALVADVAATLLSSEEMPGGVGLLTRVHAVPFQCTITVLPVKLVPPAAQTSSGETAATACSIAAPPVLAAVTRVHPVPFQCSIKALL